jgi:transcription antitermination protein NusB
MRRKAREYALQVLYAIDLNPTPVDEFFQSFWELNKSRIEIMEYSMGLVHGTVDNKKEIDSLISKHSSNWKVGRMAVTDRNILRLATYELMEEPGVPAKVIINEAIEIARKFGTTDSATFVNGVLDSIHQSLDSRQKFKTG